MEGSIDTHVDLQTHLDFPRPQATSLGGFTTNHLGSKGHTQITGCAQQLCCFRAVRETTETPRGESRPSVFQVSLCHHPVGETIMNSRDDHGRIDQAEC